MVWILLHAWTIWLGTKWLLFANVSNFPCGSLQMIILANETIVAVQPCPPSMIFLAKSGRRATLQLYSYALQFQDTLQRDWLKHSNRVQIALARRHSGHRVPCIYCARVAAKHCVCCCPWLQSLAAYCCHSFCTCNAQLGSPHNAVHCLVINAHNACSYTLSLGAVKPVECS